MSITKLDPATALVVIDLQKGIVGMPTVHPIAEIIERTARLARAFRERELPVVLVNVTGPPPGRTDSGRRNYTFPVGWDELVPELEQQPGDVLVSKKAWGAFLGTNLDDILRQRG